MQSKTILQSGDIASLSCTELVVLYFNTEWFLDRVAEDCVETGLENQILIREEIIKRFSDFPVYVICSDMTGLPFVQQDESVLVYTEKRFADMVACSMNVDYYRENIHFYAKMYDGDKEELFRILERCGIKRFSADGTKLRLEISEFYKSKRTTENADISSILIRLAQALRMGEDKDTKDAFKYAFLTKLKENPMIFHGKAEKMGETLIKPICLNDGVHQDFQESRFFTVFKSIIKNDNSITEIVFNPEREKVIISVNEIKSIASNSTVIKERVENNIFAVHSDVKKIKCKGCGKEYASEILGVTGMCSACRRKNANKNAAPSVSVYNSEKDVIPKIQTESITGISTATKGENDPFSVNADSGIKRIKCKGCGKEYASAVIGINGMCSACNRKNANEAVMTAEMIGRYFGQMNRNKRNWLSDGTKCLLYGIASILYFVFAFGAFKHGIAEINSAKETNSPVPKTVWVGLGFATVSMVFFASIILGIIFNL